MNYSFGRVKLEFSSEAVCHDGSLLVTVHCEPSSSMEVLRVSLSQNVTLTSVTFQSLSVCLWVLDSACALNPIFLSDYTAMFVR